MFHFLKLIFFFGKFLAITPSLTGPNLKSHSTKIYPVVIVSSLTIGVPVVLFYRRLDYQDLIHIKLASTVLMDVSLYIFNFVTIAGVPFWNRNQWGKIVNNLRKIEARLPLGTTNVIPYYFAYFVVNATFWFAAITDFYIWYQIEGCGYFQQYLLEAIQTYMLFYYYIVVYIFTKMLAGYYAKLCLLFEKKIACCHHLGTTFAGKNLNFLSNIEQLLRLLRDTVDLFNDLFGWPILLMIVYTSLLVINYLDDTFKNSDDLDDDEFFIVIINNVSFVLLFFVITISLVSIFFNDDFLDQHFGTDLDVRLCPSRSRKSCQTGLHLAKVFANRKPGFEEIFSCCFYHHA
jgi:gustatory receptor